MKRFIKNTLEKFGVQIKRYPDGNLKTRLKIMAYCDIDTLFDVGANAGQYAMGMRKTGYTKKIVSFEPLSSAFEGLKKAAANDGDWTVNNCALGNEDGKSIIHIAGNSYSSSILNMLPQHEESAPASKYIGQEEITIRKLDSVFRSYAGEDAGVMLKIDTQGYEKSVLDGAVESLPAIRVIQLEMSIVPLYENEMLYLEMIGFLDQKGFQLFSLENGFSDPVSGQLLQVDGIFVNKAFVQAKKH
jgi:FkbM family methyltransferase